MRHYAVLNEAAMQPCDHHRGCLILGPEQGCTGACAAGISEYDETAYAPFQRHAFQEGFYVISGEGHACIDREEFPVAPGTCFLVPADTPHSIKSGSPGSPVKVFWFHSA